MEKGKIKVAAGGEEGDINSSSQTVFI